MEKTENMYNVEHLCSCSDPKEVRRNIGLLCISLGNFLLKLPILFGVGLLLYDYANSQILTIFLIYSIVVVFIDIISINLTFKTEEQFQYFSPIVRILNCLCLIFDLFVCYGVFELTRSM